MAGYVVKELRMQKLVELLVAGLTCREAAEQLRVTEWTVQSYLREPGFMDQLKEQSVDAYARLAASIHDTHVDAFHHMEEAAALALDEMVTLMQNGKAESTRFKAAQDIMDRHPSLSRTKRIEGGGPSTQNNVINAVFLKQAITAIREEEKSA